MQFNWGDETFLKVVKEEAKVEKVVKKIAKKPMAEVSMKKVAKKAEAEKFEVASTQASEETKSTVSNAGIDICRDFLKGACRFGKECYYSHNISAHRAKQYKNGPCRNFFNNFYCKQKQACKYTHDEKWLKEQQFKNKNKNCRKLIENGKCMNGDACLFNHTGVKKFALAFAKMD